MTEVKETLLDLVNMNQNGFELIAEDLRRAGFIQRGKWHEWKTTASSVEAFMRLEKMGLPKAQFLLNGRYVHTEEDLRSLGPMPGYERIGNHLWAKMKTAGVVASSDLTPLSLESVGLVHLWRYTCECRASASTHEELAMRPCPFYDEMTSCTHI